MKPHILLLAMAFIAASKFQAAECHNITDKTESGIH